MYFSFTSIPAVKRMSFRQRMALLRKVHKLVGIEWKYFLSMAAACAGGTVVGSALHSAGFRDAALGYPVLIAVWGIWVAGYTYILNKHVYPKVLELTSQEQ